MVACSDVIKQRLIGLGLSEFFLFGFPDVIHSLNGGHVGKQCDDGDNG
jgi:hypothetical protein